MTRSAHCIGLICLAVFSGCQSIDSSVFPWYTAKQTKYKSAEEIAALNNPQPVAARVESDPEAQQMVTSTGSSQPVSTGRVQQLIQSGQASLREDQTPTQLGRARQAFQEALKLDTGNADAHHGIAIVADLEESWSAAEFHYKQALQQRPQDPGILNDLGYSYLLQNRYHESSQYLKQALHVSPQHEHAHINLALLALKRGDRPAAASQLSAIYSSDDVSTTLARLENELHATDGGTPQVDVSQPLNASFEETKRLMAEERARAQKARQEKSFREQQRLTAERVQTPTGQLTVPRPQSSIPQANIAPPPATSDAGRMLTENMVSPSGYQSYPPSNSQHPGFGGASEGAFENVPQDGYLTGHPPNQRGDVPLHNALPQFSADRSAQFPQQTVQPQQTQHTQLPRYGTQTPHGTELMPARGLIQQVTQPMTSNRYGAPQPAVPVQQFQNPAPQNYRAPVAGLNAGPGALFPISAGNVSPGTRGMNQIQLPVSQVSGQPQFSGQHAGSLPTMMPGTNTMINGGMYQQPPRVLPAEQHMQQMRYTPDNTAPPTSAAPAVGRPVFAAGGVLSPTGLPPSTQDNRAQQVIQNSSGTPSVMQTTSQGVQSGLNQSSTGRIPSVQLGSVAAPGPLAAYEQQLRGLNSQYNQAIQQVHDTRTSVNPVPARY
ncbi:MAG: hypothetical protein P8J37_07725 [Fuerstiella sp.]|nr:hypothetical protein [Fuerstiella sp.]